MIKNNPLAGVFASWRNGGSVPSIGTPSLASALVAVDAAEQALSAARSAARAAARRAGRSTRHLFDGHLYVARASAEKWVDQARAEGEQMLDILSRNLDTESTDEGSVFHHLAKRLKREGASRPDEMLRYWAALDAAGFSEATSAGDMEEAARIAVAVQREWVGKSKGAAIVRAAARARMSGDRERPDREKGSLAAQILAAGRKRRGEV